MRVRHSTELRADLPKYAEKWANAGKTVIVAGLDSTFQRRPFEAIQALIPISESITKLVAVCKLCQGSAAFTFRTGTETDVQASFVATMLPHHSSCCQDPRSSSL